MPLDSRDHRDGARCGMEDTRAWPECELATHSNHALEAYQFLLGKCDRTALNFQLTTLRESSCKPLDDWKIATDGQDRAALRKIKGRAENLKREIERLRKTPLIAALAHDGLL